MTVTKAVLAKAVRNAAGISYETASACIDILTESIAGNLAEGNAVELRGFGTFGVKTRAERKTSINGKMAVPAHGKVAFKPSERLRRAVWQVR